MERSNLQKAADTRGIIETTKRDKSFPRVNSQEDLLTGDLSAKKTSGPIRAPSRKDMDVANNDEQYENIEDLPMKYRFLNLISQQLRFDKDLEAVKESVFCYEGFSTQASFKQFDPRGTGVLSQDSFQHLDDEMDVDELIEALDINKDGMLNYTEWCRAITPKDKRFKPPPVRSMGGLTQQEREIRSFNWRAEMKNLLSIYSKSEDFND